jgi:hypothetical protein
VVSLGKTRRIRRGIKNDKWIFREQLNELCSEVKNVRNVSGMNYKLVQFWVESQATETSEGNILKRWKLKLSQTTNYTVLFATVQCEH